MNRFFLALVFVLSVSATVGRAAGIPVFDGSNFSQNQLQALENVKQTLKQLEEYRTQLEQFEEQLRNGMGLGDLLGQFEDMFANFQDMQNGFSLEGGNFLGQAAGFKGAGDGDGKNYFQSGGTTTNNYFHYQHAGSSPEINWDSIYGANVRHYYEMPQSKIREYVYIGAEQQNVANKEWINQIYAQKEQLDKDTKEGMEQLQKMVDEAGNDEEGGTNKLLGATNALLLKLVQQNWTLHQMMITRETSEAIMYMNQAARQQDMDAQSIRLREDAEIYQQQGKGNKPMEWR